MNRFPTLARVAGYCTALLTVCMFLAANWPQWRGPNRDGISQEKGLLQDWPTAGPPMVWRVDGLGDGYSTPAIVGDRIYLISSTGLDNEYVQALDTARGKQIWSKRIGKVGNPDQRPPYPGARSTPTIDGDLLFALGSDGDLVCMDRADGNIRWRKNLRSDFDGKPGEWAYSESPLVDGDRLVVTPGGERATLVALNKNTGETILEMPVPPSEEAEADTDDEAKADEKRDRKKEAGEEAAYASVIIVDAAGVKQYVQFLAKGLVGFDANTGKLLWRFDRPAQSSPANILTPVAHGDMVYAGTHYGGGGAVRLVAKDGGVAAEEVYFDKKLPTAIGGAVLVGDYMYGTNRESLMCANFKTGEVPWTEPRGMAPASICYADGRLYLHSEKDGTVALIEATPDGYREHGKFMPEQPPERGSAKPWQYPVIADGRLYIHDWGTMWCYDVRAKAGAQ